MLTKIEEALKMAMLECSEDELRQFFDTKFLTPLNTLLDGTEVPAETIRHKRQQTNHIKNFFLTIRKS